MKPRPFIGNARTAKLLGWVLFAAGALTLYDAYDRRGGKAPWPLSGILPF
jgi:hypothetical protein